MCSAKGATPTNISITCKLLGELWLKVIVKHCWLQKHDEALLKVSLFLIRDTTRILRSVEEYRSLRPIVLITLGF